MNWSRVFLFSVLVAALVLLSTEARPALAVGSEVDTTSDANLTACSVGVSGDCSLRGAINNANLDAGNDVITFAIPANSDPGCDSVTGICTIAPGSPLPTITSPGLVDGFSQSGALQNTNPTTLGSNASLKIVLSGTGAGMGANGLFVDFMIAGSTTLQGLVINGFSGAGIRIENVDGVFVRGNYIGTDAQGSADLGNGGHGVDVSGGSSLNNVIGGTAPSNRNVISGNQASGALLTGSGHLVQGNFIGVSASGVADVGNSVDGIAISGANTNCIGGATAGTCIPTVAARNVISGNDSDGIDIQGAGATNNRIVNNYVGLQLDGVSARGNTSQGIQAVNSASNNSLGGTTGGNRIAFNGGAGLFIDNGSAANSIRANSIHSNGGGVTTLGIDLFPLGVTANDAGDGDTGANNLQNFPVLASALKKGSSTLIAGSINSTAATTFDVDFFVSDNCDPSGNGEGATYLGTAAGVGPTDGVNDVSFGFSAGASLIGKFITATATRTAAPLDTSEFSNCVPVAPMIVDTTSDATLTACAPAGTGDCSLRGALANANTAASPGDLINFNIPAGSAGCVGTVDPVCTITIGSALPVLNISGGGNDTIDGAGASVIIKGAEARSYGCIFLDSSGNTVRNLELTDCADAIGCCGGNTNNTIGPGINAYDNNFGVAIGGTSNTVIGNRFGTNAAGTAVHPDGGNNRGVVLAGDNNTVGGTSAPDRNIISGNAVGLELQTGAGSNSIKGNYIGTDVTGTVDLGNTFDGVFIFNAANNCIGGTIVASVCTATAGSGNLISGNNQNGIGVQGATATGNTIRGNSIHSNTGKGIENASGGNGEPGHAPPVVDAVGSASGTACANCVVDLYSDSVDEGRVYHGSATADDNGDGTGDWSFSGVVIGPNVTATATNSGGSTSEFSAPFPCAGAADSDGDTICNSGDNCPSVANTNQGNFDGDTQGDACDSEDDGDGFTDVNESGTPLCGANVNHDGPPPVSPPVNDDTLVNDGCPAVGAAEANCADTLDNDGDGAFNDGCPKVGTFSEAQFKIGTGSLDPCGNNGWPLELVSTPASTANRYNISDLASFVSGVRKLGKNPNQAGFDSRWDLEPGNSGLNASGWINIVDLGKTTGGATAFPPMLGGVRVLNQLCPFPP